MNHTTNHTTQPTFDLSELPEPMAAASEQKTPPAEWCEFQTRPTQTAPGLKVRVSVRAGLGAAMMSDPGTRRP